MQKWWYRVPPERILLLPALPRAWKEGRITGLCVKGSTSLDLGWRNGELPINKYGIFLPASISRRNRDSYRSISAHPS
ncbi:glycoside hydrolase family 95-like protein [Anaerocolumna jejuensis]|uniref:glycoside hydrolase family 95-like protein n=1 Tax=Anaerocolumna jejuensis TaxID=259063 RepID=UPI003F7BD72F